MHASSTAMVIELCFFHEDEEESVNHILPVLHTSSDIFIQFFACSYFWHVLHLDVRLGLKLKVKANISLCMAIMLDHP